MNLKRNMLNRFVILIGLVSMIAFDISAKLSKKNDYPCADIKVSYNYHEKFLRGNNEFVEKDVSMLLLANSKQSKFYCPGTEYKDSLESTPSGRATRKQIRSIAYKKYHETGDESIMDGVVYQSFLYVFKDYAKEQSTIYDKAGILERGVYSESFSELTWEIGDSTKTVLGYECVMATADYHGRKWTAWCTREIPVQDGPWKLRGLPGLILEATEEKGHHSFVADGIEQSNQIIYPIYDKDKYDKMSRKEMLKSLRNTRDNGNSIIKASTGGMLDLGQDSQPQTDYDFLETDYRL